MFRCLKYKTTLLHGCLYEQFQWMSTGEQICHALCVRRNSFVHDVQHQLGICKHILHVLIDLQTLLIKVSNVKWNVYTSHKQLQAHVAILSSMCECKCLIRSVSWKTELLHTTNGIQLLKHVLTLKHVSTTLFTDVLIMMSSALDSESINHKQMCKCYKNNKDKQLLLKLCEITITTQRLWMTRTV